MQVSTRRLLVQGIDEAMAVSMVDGPRPAESSSPFGLFVIRLLPDRIACGGAGFFGPPDDDGVVEFGYGLVPAHAGRGWPPKPSGRC